MEENTKRKKAHTSFGLKNFSVKIKKSTLIIELINIIYCVFHPFWLLNAFDFDA